MKSKLEMEASTALGIVQSLAQSIADLESYWAPSKRGSNAGRALAAIKDKRKAIETCLRDGLEETKP